MLTPEQIAEYYYENPAYGISYGLASSRYLESVIRDTKLYTNWNPDNFYGQESGLNASQVLLYDKRREIGMPLQEKSTIKHRIDTSHIFGHAGFFAPKLRAPGWVYIPPSESMDTFLDHCCHQKTKIITCLNNIIRFRYLVILWMG